MKKILPFLCVLFIFSCAEKNSRSTLIPEQIDRIEKSVKLQFAGIELSDEQVAAMMEYHLTRWENQKKGNFGPTSQVGNVSNFPKELKDDLYAMLTEDQQKKMDIFNEELKAAVKGQEIWKAENLKSIRAYSDYRSQIQSNEINPVIYAQRMKLENLLTDEDKMEIARLTKAKKDNRKARDDAKHTPEWKENWPASAESPSYRKLKDEKRKISEARTALALKLQPQMDEVLNEIMPQRIEWERKISEQLNIAYKDAPLRKFNEALFRRKWQVRSYEIDEYNRTSYQRFFMSMDPTNKMDYSQKSNQGMIDLTRKAHLIYPIETISTETETELTFEIPIVSTKQLINYSLLQEGNVVIEIQNAAGETIQEIQNEELDAGNYDKEIDLNRIGGADNFFKVKAPLGTTATIKQPVHDASDHKHLKESKSNKKITDRSKGGKKIPIVHPPVSSQ